jgi:hypothetical protein
VAQLYPQAPGSFPVAFFDSQGYGGGILTRLNTRGIIIIIITTIPWSSVLLEKLLIAVTKEFINILWNLIFFTVFTRALYEINSVHMIHSISPRSNLILSSHIE